MRLRARACAKINLGLKIVGRRGDGFHELRTVFQTIGLADRLEMEIVAGRGGAAAIELETSGLEAPAGVDNLAYRAALIGAGALGVRGRIRLRLAKRIPSRAGLGGGSSDAAAVLRMLALAAPRPPAPGVLLRLAAELGSDVAPFLIGGTVLGLGRGAEVYALPDLFPWHCVLAMPRAGAGAAVSTPEAFSRWDREHPGRDAGLTAAAGSDTIMEFCSLVDQVLPAFRPGRNRGATAASAAGGPKVQAGIENDVQAGVFSLSPDFPRIHLQLQRSQASWISLSGSGAAQFGLFSEAEPARAAAARLNRRYRSWATRFVGRQAYHRGLRVIAG